MENVEPNLCSTALLTPRSRLDEDITTKLQAASKQPDAHHPHPPSKRSINIKHSIPISFEACVYEGCSTVNIEC